MFTQESRRVRGYKIKRPIIAQGLLKVTYSHVRCKSGSRPS